MKKISNKGFVLAETIVVAVFMVTIFSVLYSNYFPIMANYEKREYYDDLDSKYTIFWLKYMLQDSDYNFTPASNDINNPSKGFAFFDCNKINNSSKSKSCKRLVKEAGLTTNPYCKDSSNNKCSLNSNYNSVTYTGELPLKFVAIITKYNITDLKAQLTNPSSLIYQGVSDGMIDYINSLPNYVNASNNGANYRLIIELYDDREVERTPLYKYSTIEVTR